MTDLQTAFEALMPEPFEHLYEFASPFGGTMLRESSSEYNGNRPKRSIALYTADQMRQAIQAASDLAAKREREECAKLVLSGPPPRKVEGGRVEIGERARAAFAAAIRARDGGTS